MFKIKNLIRQWRWHRYWKRQNEENLVRFWQEMNKK